jgi:hypothetical protein
MKPASLFLRVVSAGSIVAAAAMGSAACSSTSSTGEGGNAPTNTGDDGTGNDSGTAGGSSGGVREPADAAPAPLNDAGVVLAADGGTVEDINPTASDFDCLKNSEWTTVGVSRYKNLLGHEAETVAAAQSPTGGIFPVGTFVQLIPTEAMVKRGKGYSAASDDWEFFALNVSATGTTIGMSGGTSSVTNLFGTCLGCHGGAMPQFDFVCGDADGGNTHGCAALPLSGSVLMSTSDPRCP